MDEIIRIIITDRAGCRWLVIFGRDGLCTAADKGLHWMARKQLTIEGAKRWATRHNFTYREEHVEE